MEIISRKYGVAKNHIRYVVITGVLQQRKESINDRIRWKGKRNWEFECIKYEKQDHCFVKFKGMEDAIFIVKLLDFSKHAIYDDLYKHDSDDYVKWILLSHITELFENRMKFPDFNKYSHVFEQYIEMNEPLYN